MIDKRDLTALQFMAVVVIIFAASWPEVRQFFSHAFPYADVVIPAGAFILLFQALFWAYSHYLWKLHLGTTYLGGQWIYKTKKNELNEDNQFSYGVFEVMHTADKLLMKHGEVWDSQKSPHFENRDATWESNAIIYQDEKLWVVSTVIADDASQSRQLALFDVIRRKSQIKMGGIIWGVADPDGEYASGFTEMRKISNHPRSDAAREAYQTFRSS